MAATALARVQIPVKLNNREIRFLRDALGWQSRTLAKKLGVAPETVSRWASADTPAPITPSNEKLLRLFIVKNLKDKAPGVSVDAEEILEMEIPPFRKPDESLTLTCWRRSRKKSRKARPV
ncbi:MAG TPA: helix-turn-helix domain-containing protein, partial [Candidatus Binataceae bacterium]|nr:helix-turn-helix domain-containing protein [Candidatus Binataceae bacterium]